jgi:hypothetical protein
VQNEEADRDEDWEGHERHVDDPFTGLKVLLGQGEQESVFPKPL